ncbi:type I restriction enzyme HsdR N-terminal domain-containing protein [soil metagenome]
MIRIDFSPIDFKIKKQKEKDIIFDEFRKKWVKLTPEEWVRQNILHYITKEKMYPASLIAVEKELMLGELKKRCDVVVYNRDNLPWMIIECKEMNTPITESVMDQILRYHITLPAEFLIVTNGVYCFGFKKEQNKFELIKELPDY